MRVRRIAREVYDTDDLPSPFLEEFFALVRYRELIFQLVSRSVKTRYKRSVLGVAWIHMGRLKAVGIPDDVVEQYTDPVQNEQGLINFPRLRNP